MWENDNGLRICPRCGAPVVSTTLYDCVNAYCERCEWHTSNITDDEARRLREITREIDERDEARP